MSLKKALNLALRYVRVANEAAEHLDLLCPTGARNAGTWKKRPNDPPSGSVGTLTNWVSDPDRMLRTGATSFQRLSRSIPSFSLTSNVTGKPPRPGASQPVSAIRRMVSAWLALPAASTT